MENHSLDYYTMIKFAHVLFNGPLLIYIGISKPTDIWIYYLLLLMSTYLLIITIKHIVQKKAYKWIYVHLAIIAPLLLYTSYLGITKQKINRDIYSFIRALGFGALGLHMSDLSKVLLKNIISKNLVITTK